MRREGVRSGSGRRAERGEARARGDVVARAAVRGALSRDRSVRSCRRSVRTPLFASFLARARRERAAVVDASPAAKTVVGRRVGVPTRLRGVENQEASRERVVVDTIDDRKTTA